jgi:hypothetical protein
LPGFEHFVGSGFLLSGMVTSGASHDGLPLPCLKWMAEKKWRFTRDKTEQLARSPISDERAALELLERRGLTRAAYAMKREAVLQELRATPRAC